MRRIVLLLCCATALLFASLRDIEAAGILVLRQGAEAFVVRLQIDVDGAALDKLAERRAAALFKAFDRDEDGRLNAAEVQSLPSEEALIRLMRGEFFDLPMANTAGEKGVAAADVQALAKAYSTALAGLDLVVDDAETPPESPTAVRGLFTFLAGDAEQISLKLPDADLPLRLRRHDADGDGRLGLDELWYVPSPKPAASQEESTPGAKWTIERAAESTKNSTSEVVNVRISPNASVDEAVVAAKPVTVRIVAGAGTSNVETAAAEIWQAFETDDGDGNKQLSTDEREQSPDAELWTALAGLAGVAENQSLTAEKLHQLFELAKTLAADRVVVTLKIGGNRLFTELDRDGDRRLTPRELVRHAERLQVWDGDGRLAWSEIPQRRELTVSLGTPLPSSNVVPSANNGLADVPRWFAAMDRNADGDVAAAEFLGAVEQFQKLDRDGDGLLSPQEAVNVGK
ncbi:MAG: hypothetical protein QM775_03935 [Pirellulales bacterium]